MEPVVITGFGVISPLGHSVEELTARVAAGERAPVDDASGACVAAVPMAAVPADKQARLGRLDRLCRFFLAAAYLAVEAADLAIAPEEAERIGLSFGTGLGCLLTNEEYNRKVVAQGPAAASPRLFTYTVSSAAAGEVSIALGIKGPNVTAHMGFAAGLGAVGYGFDLIQMGKADVVLAGGADVIGPALAEGLRDMGLLKTLDAARPFRDAQPGVYPAEGAVVAVLERRARAQRRGARLWARIDGYAAGFEPSLTRRTRAHTGVAATLQRALTLSRHAPGEIDLVVSSAHGTPVDDVERAAVAEVLGAHATTLMLAPKAALGESFGASGTLGLVLAAGVVTQPQTWADGVAFTVDGQSVDGAEAGRRLRSTSVVAIDSLCYSGNIVSLVLARDE